MTHFSRKVKKKKFITFPSKKNIEDQELNLPSEARYKKGLKWQKENGLTMNVRMAIAKYIAKYSREMRETSRKVIKKEEENL